MDIQQIILGLTLSRATWKSSGSHRSGVCRIPPSAGCVRGSAAGAGCKQCCVNNVLSVSMHAGGALNYCSSRT